MINKNIFYPNNLINICIVLYAFCLPLTKPGTAIFSILAMILWVFQGNFKNKFNEIKGNSFLLALGGFLLYSCISILWSSDKAYALWYLRKYWHFLMIPIIFTMLKKEYIKHVFSAFLLAMFISEVASYGVFFEVWKLKNATPHDPTVFMDRIAYSSFLVLTVFILLQRVFQESVFKINVIYLFFLLMSLTSLFLNGGRTGQVIFFVAIFVFIFLNIKHKILGFVISLLMGVFVFYAAFFISPNFEKRINEAMVDIERMVKQDNFRGSISARVAMWIVGYESYKLNPIFGSGIGDEVENTQELVKKYGLTPHVSKRTENTLNFHSCYVKYSVQLGIIGLFLLMLIFVTLYKTKIEDKNSNNLLIIFIVIYLLMFFTDEIFHLNRQMSLFVLFSGLFISIAKIESDYSSAS